MAGFKGLLAATAASFFVVGSLTMFSSDALSASGGSRKMRSEADTAAHGAAVSRPLMGGSAATTSTTGSSGGSMSGGSMSSSGGSGSAMSSGPAMTSKKDVMAAQRALNANGAHLKVDGKMGPNTRRALMNYQAQNGMTVTGQLDSGTASKLGM